MLVRDENMKERYTPLPSTIVLERKEENLWISKNDLTKDALVDSRAHVSAITESELERNKQQAPTNVFKNDDLPNFQTHVGNYNFEKPIGTTTLKFGTGENTFAKNFVVMKKLEEQFMGLHFMRHNSVVIDTTQSLVIFPDFLTTDLRSANSVNFSKQKTLLSNVNLTLPPMTTKTISAPVAQTLDWRPPGTLSPREKFTETASLPLSHSMLTIICKIVAVRVTNTTEIPYTIRKNNKLPSCP